MNTSENLDLAGKCGNSSSTQTGSNGCSFFMPGKNRFCKMKPETGFRYCPQHSHLCPDQTSKKGIRIPCPLDPSHTCYLSRLEQHKKKCNAREGDKPPYYKQNVNSGDKSENKTKVTVSDTSDEELLYLIDKVDESYKREVPILAEINTFHPVLKTEMEKSEVGMYSVKNLQQQASLLSAMDQYGLLHKGTCFIEFGAGKGQLMYWVILIHREEKNKTYILVDRAAQRYKFDNKFKQDNEVNVERIRIDIEHLYLGKIECIEGKSHKIVGLSKHLCGSATDLALRCMLGTTKSDENLKAQKTVPLGMVMAQCCHHRCTWGSYVGKDFMEKNGFTEKDFQLMCRVASWATCGTRKANAPCENDSVPEYQGDCTESIQGDLVNRYIKLGLSHSKREEIGRKCKRLIDMGRIHYLQQHNLTAELVIYVDSSVTLENVAIIAVSQSV